MQGGSQLQPLKRLEATVLAHRQVQKRTNRFIGKPTARSHIETLLTRLI